MSLLLLVPVDNFCFRSCIRSQNSPTDLCQCFSLLSNSLHSAVFARQVSWYSCSLLILSPRVTKCQPGLFAAAAAANCAQVESQSSVLHKAVYVEQLWKKVEGEKGGRGLWGWQITWAHWKAGFSLRCNGHRGKSYTWKCRKIGHIYISEMSCQLKM